MSESRNGALRPFEPTDFGRFTLLAPLASGGMGQIYLARARFHGGLEKLCVIKKVLPRLADDPDFVSRFLDEARTLVELQHGSIAQVYDTGVEDGEYWIALEFVDGKDLRRLLQRLRAKGEKLPLPLALYVAIKILEALAHAHRKRDAAGRQLNLVHRDVSPQNVLLSYEGEVKVIDFGLARSRLTGSADGSIVMGKFHYMAPEQARGAEVDRRADLYALGVILYEMVSGWNPFEDAPDGQVLEWAAFPRIPPVERVCPGLPAAVAIAIGQALAIQPLERFQTAEEMRRALSSCLSDLGPDVGPEELGGMLVTEFEAEYERERSWIASFAKRENKPSRAAEEETQFAAAPQLQSNTLRFEGEGEELPWNRDRSDGAGALRSAAAAARSEPGELPWYENRVPREETAKGARRLPAIPPPPGNVEAPTGGDPTGPGALSHLSATTPAHRGRSASAPGVGSPASHPADRQGGERDPGATPPGSAGRSKWMPLALVAVTSAAVAGGTLWFLGGSPETRAAGVSDQDAGRTVDIAHKAAPRSDAAPATADAPDAAADLAARADAHAEGADAAGTAAEAAVSQTDTSEKYQEEASGVEGHARAPAAAVALAPSPTRAGSPEQGPIPSPAPAPGARSAVPPSGNGGGAPTVAQPSPKPASPQTTVASAESAIVPAGDTPAPTEPPTSAQQRARLERFRLSVQKKYDFLVERHGSDQVGGIVGELVRAMNSQFDRLIDAPDHYDELHSRLDDLDRLLEERRKAFVH